MSTFDTIIRYNKIRWKIKSYVTSENMTKINHELMKNKQVKMIDEEGWIRKPQNIDNLICNSVEEVFTAVNKYLKKFDYETATAILTREIDKNPNELEYRKKRVQVMMAQHKDCSHYADGAMDAFAYALYPVKDINYRNILVDCSEILKTENTEYYYSSRAEIFEWCGYLEQSINDLLKCIKFNPINFRYYMELAKAYERNENYQKAIEVYDYLSDNFAILENKQYKYTHSVEDLLTDIYIRKYNLHKKLCDNKSAFNDLLEMALIEDKWHFGYYSEYFIKYCYKLKKYDVAYKYLKNKYTSIKYFLIPFIYKKLNKLDKEKEYYINFIKDRNLLVEEKTRYLRTYRYLINLEKNWFKRLTYIYRYYLDKNILFHIKNKINSVKMYIDFMLNGDDDVLI